MEKINQLWSNRCEICKNIALVQTNIKSDVQSVGEVFQKLLHKKGNLLRVYRFDYLPLSDG
jgi:hypothetical protein